MALVLADRVKETTTTTGTGTVTLAGASAGYRSFATVGNGNTTYYTISGQTTSEWEVGIGTYTTVGTTLSRTTVLSSSNGGSLVVFSAGTKDVFVTYPAGRSVNVDAANTGVSVPQLSATSIINSGLTSGRVVYSTTGGLETDSANLTFNGTTLTANTIGAFTLSGTIAGGGNQINNVIIGTTTPLAGAFTTLSATGVTTVQAGTALLPAIVSTTGTADTGIWFPAADTVAASTAGTERMRINSSGNLGIGTTSPGSRLSVVGGSLATAGTGILAAGALTAGRLVSDGVNATINPIHTYFDSYAYEISAGSTSGYVTGVVVAARSFTGTGGEGVSFWTRSAERMRVDGSGNVGIGTTAPGAKLDVQNANAYVRIKSTSGTYALFDIDSPAASQPIIRFLSNGVEQARIISPVNEAASQLVFTTGSSSTERMRIDASGNVGIGTSSNATNVKLQVVSPTNTLINSRGNAYIYTTEAAGIDKGAQLTLGGQYTGGEVPFASIAGRAEAAAGALQGYMQFGTINTSGVIVERMRIDSSGNVGIGASSPVDKLQVEGNIYLGTTGRTIYQGSSADLTLQVNTGNIKFFRANGVSESMRIDSSGNVLIGATSVVLTSKLLSSFSAATSVGLVLNETGGGSSTTFANFSVGSVAKGSITWNGTSVLYNNLSDYRLKENIQDADSASALIDALQVRQFDWKSNNSHQRYGFIAQELVTVAPEAVHQPADPDKMMAVDYSKLVPMLVKEIQSLRKRLTALESKEIS